MVEKLSVLGEHGKHKEILTSDENKLKVAVLGYSPVHAQIRAGPVRLPHDELDNVDGSEHSSTGSNLPRCRHTVGCTFYSLIQATRTNVNDNGKR